MLVPMLAPPATVVSPLPLLFAPRCCCSHVTTVVSPVATVIRPLPLSLTRRHCFVPPSSWHSWALVGGSALGIWAERAGGGAYLGPPFLCPPWLYVLGIPYASSWAFGPAYAIFGVLVTASDVAALSCMVGGF